MKSPFVNSNIGKSCILIAKLSFTLLLLLNCSVSTFAQSKPWPVPSTAVNTKNPIVADANIIKTGKTLYVSYCAPCHGNSGKGDGIAAATLNPKPANHTSAIIQAESDGSLFYKITTGRTPMPTYKTALTDAQRWTLVCYIKTLGMKP